MNAISSKQPLIEEEEELFNNRRIKKYLYEVQFWGHLKEEGFQLKGIVANGRR